MLWVLWDIFLPVVAAFLVGLLVGWMLWRWRRSRIDANSISSLRQSASRLKTDADNLRIRNAELSDRLQVASGARQTATQSDHSELDRARKRIEVLSAELKASRQQVDKLRKSGVAGRAGPAGEDMSEAIKARDNMIKTLQTSLDQYGDSQDTTTLKACVALRDKKIVALEDLLDQANRRGN